MVLPSPRKVFESCAPETSPMKKLVEDVQTREGHWQREEEGTFERKTVRKKTRIQSCQGAKKKLLPPCRTGVTLAPDRPKDVKRPHSKMYPNLRQACPSGQFWNGQRRITKVSRCKSSHLIGHVRPTFVHPHHVKCLLHCSFLS